MPLWKSFRTGVRFPSSPPTRSRLHMQSWLFLFMIIPISMRCFRQKDNHLCSKKCFNINHITVHRITHHIPKDSHSNRIFSIVSMHTVSVHQISHFFYVPILICSVFLCSIAQNQPFRRHNQKDISSLSSQYEHKNNPHQYYLMGTLILWIAPEHFRLRCQFCLYIEKEQISFLLDS